MPIDEELIEGMRKIAIDMPDEFTTLVYRVLLTSAYGVVLILALTGNSVILFVFLKSKEMLTRMSMFVTSLAVSDLLICLAWLPCEVVMIVLDLKSSQGSWMCKLIPFNQTCFAAVNSFTMCCIALERYHAIVHPLRSRSGSPIYGTILIIAFTWLIGILLGTPYLIAFEAIEVNTTEGNQWYCIDKWVRYYPQNEDESLMLEKVFLWLTFTLVFACPFLLLLVLYACIAHRLWIRKPIGDTIQAAQVCYQYKKIGIRMCAAVVLVFSMCWTPLFVSKLTELYQAIAQNRVTVQHLMTMQYLTLLAISSSVWNPFSYIFLQKTFKRQVAMVMPWCFQEPFPGSTMNNSLRIPSSHTHSNATPSPAVHQQALNVTQLTVPGMLHPQHTSLTIKTSFMSAKEDQVCSVRYSSASSSEESSDTSNATTSEKQ